MTLQEQEERIFESIVCKWGYVVGPAGLRQVLGYTNQGALRRAIAAGRVQVPVFTLRGRKGHFAAAHELARWVVSRSVLPALTETPCEPRL